MSAEVIKLPAREIPNEVIVRAEYARGLLVSPLHDAWDRGDYLTASRVATEFAGIASDIARAGFSGDLAKKLEQRMDEFIAEFWKRNPPTRR